MSFHIHGLGTATPEYAISQHDAATLAAQFCQCDPSQQQLLAKLYARSGVEQRHSVLLDNPDNDDRIAQRFYGQAHSQDDRGPTTAARMAVYREQAVLLGVQAAERALRHGDVSATEITDLVTVSCSGFSAPGIDIQMIRRLGLRNTVSRTHVGFMGCHGAINGLRVAESISAANRKSVVLLAAVELCSLHQQYGWDTDRIVSNSLFADGAAAVVGSCGDDHSRHCTVSAFGSTVVPDTEEQMQWNIGDHGFEMSLSPRVPEIIRQTLRPWAEQWLASYHTSVTDIQSWIIHPGGPRILDASADSLGLRSAELDDSRTILARYGNMSSPTVLFILQSKLTTGLSLPGVLLGFGPGLVIEAALITA